MARSFIPRRWETISPLLDAALDRPPEERSTYLDSACSGDAELRKEVEAVLADCESSSSRFNTGAMEQFGSLLAGDSIELPPVLAGRYAIEKQIGRGATATVHLARDLRHGRHVALKVLNPELRVLVGPQRFLAEIRVTSALQHPNVLPLFDSGEVDGLLFYVMPFVDGETLRHRLNRERQLPIDEAIRITAAVAAALDYAHRHGVVHRDLKPENILLSDGQPLVADFGIALALSEAGGDRMTQSGVSLGTPLYMSPEQIGGDQHIDGRSDTYSLGCVLHEMLTGEPPFVGHSAQAIFGRKMSQSPPSARVIRDAVPEHVDRSIQRAIARFPADRFTSVDEFSKALVAPPSPVRSPRPMPLVARLSVAAAAVAAVIFFGWKLATTQTPPGLKEEISRQRIAVLPFQFDGDTGLRYMADGLTDGVINGLVRIPDIDILFPSSGAEYRNRGFDPSEAGRSLKAHKVVFARLEASGNTLRVTATLLNVADGRVLWQDKQDAVLVRAGQLEPVFLITDSLAVKIIDVIRPRVAAERRALAARGARTRSPEAFRLYQRSLALGGVNAHPDSAGARVEALTKAVELDSNFADAWAMLAEAKMFETALKGTLPVKAGPELRRLVAKSLSIDSTNAQALMLQGRFRWFYDWDWDGALNDVRRAYEIAPSSVPISEQYQWLLTFSNQNDSALAIARRSLDTTSQRSWWNLSSRFIHAGMLDSALVASEHGAAVDSSDILTRMDLMFLYYRAGRRADADSVARLVLPQAEADNPHVIAAMSDYYDYTGNRSGAQRMRDRILRIAATQRVKQDWLATVMLNAGDREGAIRHLQEAVKDREPGLFLFFWTAYSRLQGDPRVEAARVEVFGTRRVVRSPYRP